MNTQSANNTIFAIVAVVFVIVVTLREARPEPPFRHVQTPTQPKKKVLPRGRSGTTKQNGIGEDDAVR